MTTDVTPTASAPGPTMCARHPDVETGLACGRCGTPICPRCLVYTPAGTRCPTCASIGRPKMYVLAPLDYARAVATSVIAGALLGDPEVLVLDEPANGLDPIGIVWLRELLRRLAAEGRTVLVSSHQLAEMQHTVDDVLVIDRGRLLAQGTIAEVTQGRSLEDAFLAIVGAGA